MKTRARIVLAVVTVACGGAGIAACILADPPPLPLIPAVTAPQILTQAVSPPLNQLITNAPGQSLTFSVPVETDPNQSLEWRVLVDVDPNVAPLGGGLALRGIEDGGVLATGPDASTVVVVPVDFTLTSQLDFSQCHVITVVVAYSFVPGLAGTPFDPPGGSFATWRYQPVEDCNYFDAAPPLDASALGDGADE